MMKLRWLFLPFLVFFTSLAFAHDLRDVQLQLKWKHQFQFAGYYTAIEKGYYRDAGLNVHLKELNNDQTPFDEVFNGRAEFGVCTTDILVARSQSKNAVVLATIFQHSPHIIITLRSSGIQFVQDLVGKRIASEPEAADFYAFFVAEGLSLKQCILEELNFSTEQLVEGKVDAITAYLTDEPYALKQQGHEINILSPTTAGIDFYGDLLFTSETLIKSDPDLVKHFREASLKGWVYAMAHQEEIVQLIYKKYSKRHSLDQLRYEATQMQRLISPNVVEIGYNNPGRWDVILDCYKKAGLVDPNLTNKGLLYNDFMKSEFRIPWRIILITGIAFLVVLAFLTFYFYHSKALRAEIRRRETIQKELAASEALYRSILKASPDNVTVTSLNGTIRAVSQAALQMMGYEREEEVIGKNARMFIRNEDLTRVRESLQLIVSGQYQGPDEFTLVGKDGSLVETEVKADLFRDTEGNPDGMVFMIRDIRERKAREMELKQKNAALIKTNAEKNKFFSIISHDLRSPFNAFLGLTQVLINSARKMDQQQITTYANNLHDSAATLYRLLENLLQWSRVERGLTIPQFGVFALNPVIFDIQRTFHESFEFKRLTFATDLSEDFLTFADKDMVETILRNLISNAVKFTPPAGRITITVQKTQTNMLEISVNDTGIGMDRDIVENLFRVDVNVKREGTEGESSSGLGLLLCKEFVELNGGTMKVQSAEGKGSTFTFTLKCG